MFAGLKAANETSGNWEKALAAITNGGSAGVELPPISFRPSPYHVRVLESTVYASSATVCLYLPMLIKADIQVETQCPTNGSMIHLEITDQGVISSTPEECVLSVVIPSNSVVASGLTERPARSELSNLMRFFSSREAAITWLVAFPNAAVLGMDDAWLFAHEIYCRDGSLHSRRDAPNRSQEVV
jgi:hypothetical protein